MQNPTLAQYRFAKHKVTNHKVAVSRVTVSRVTVSRVTVSRVTVSRVTKHRFSILSLLFVVSALPALSLAGVVISNESDRSAVALTIYNSNIALIKENRNVELPQGTHALELRGVSARIMPETVLFSSAAKRKPTVLEQNFDYDLLTPAKLLDKYVGQDIRIVRTNPATGQESTENARVLSNNQGPVVQIGNRIETNPGGRFIFDSIPQNLRDTPTLSILLENPAASNGEVGLSYLSTGLSWKADYVASLNADDDRVDLNGWVTLSNNSGASYSDAILQLVAGDVNRVQAPLVKRNRLQDIVVTAEAQTSGLQQESLFEYHLYTLARPTSILDKQNKQVALLNANSVPVSKKLILNGGGYYYQGRNAGNSGKLKLGVFVELKNEKENGLGIPLPKGTVRVYKEDTSGNAQFIGEDAIDHTANKGKIKLKLGESFDVFAERKQTSYNVIEKLVGRNIVETSHEITLTNGKKSAEPVIVREQLPGEWKVTKESHNSSKLDARTAEWQLTIPAESKLKLSFTVQTKF